MVGREPDSKNGDFNYMSLLKFLKRKPKVSDADDKRRLAIALNERPLREFFNEEHFEAVKRARAFVFQDTPEIRRIPRERTS